MAAPTALLPRQRGFAVLRWSRTGWSARVDTRAVLVSVGLAAGTFLVFAWSLAVGDFPLAVGDVIRSLLGQGSSDTDFIVRTLRLPRGLTGLLVGAAFGLSGAVLQRLARNPLASPDVIGVSHGAAAAAVFVIVVLHGSADQVTIGALAGALAAVAAVYLLAYKRGATGYRLVLVGIGITAMLASVTSYLLTRAELVDVQRATVWLTGSLNGRGWEHVRPVSVALLVLVPLTLGLARHLRVLELGDDAARGLGARVDRSRA
ncbi:MAG TPA: iron chelate uptake ABC transporter family permease subunit, partial [Acidimicrobiales bacterium]|nr:iron chelate uptake ABC transporter family permease subunit [Acidimicrobiales bacterium]